VRVLLQGRSARSVATAPGGDQLQLEETAKSLRSDFDVEAVTSSSLEPDLRGYDLVHLFGIVRPQEVWLQARNARRQDVPIVLSTVYCDVSEFEHRDRRGPVGWLGRRLSPNVFEAMKAGGRTVVSGELSKGSVALFVRGYQSMQEDIIRMTSTFLPNSWSEWKRFREDFAITEPSSERVAVVPNGVDPTDWHLQKVSATDMAAVSEFEGCVLCVARMEGRKNQIRLIDALADTGLRVVLAGRAAPNQKRYVTEVYAAAKRHNRTAVLGEVSPVIKRALYAVARVHAMPSWMETTGISSLEAAVMDCSLVVSPNGDTREYFGDLVDYCAPGDPQSIRNAVLRAYDRAPCAALKEKITTEYTWKRAAEATHRAYRRTLTGRGV
jgi:glycosyltransferase involved in cell wall biosynthesis